MRLATVLRVLWSHWTYRPLQFFTLLIGLSLATGLWTGVQAINTEARTSYEQASSVLLSNTLDHLERSDGQPIKLQTYVALQQAGWRTSPVLEGQTRAAIGQPVRVIGIDPVTMPPAMADLTNAATSGESDGRDLVGFLTPPRTIIVSADLTDFRTDRVELASVTVSDNLLANTILTDISVAEKTPRPPR